MTYTNLLIEELIRTVSSLGLNQNLMTPMTLSEAGNLIIHLSPYPIVARIANRFEGDDAGKLQEILETELEVVRHLKAQDVPVVSFSTEVSPGPHKVASTWMTLWEYVEAGSSPPLLETQIISLLDQLTNALEVYPSPLPKLGVWNNVIQGAAFLEHFKYEDSRILHLLEEYKVMNEQLKQVTLVPAHGDAHPNNLIPSSTGWRWHDFEDVSLMPRHWDLASVVSNPTLFEGFTHPYFKKIMKLNQVRVNRSDFYFAMKARVIMSVTTNLALARDGRGDLEFAQAQLQRFAPYLDLLKTTFN